MPPGPKTSSSHPIINKDTTGLTTKKGQQCSDRCGCVYPEGWSSGNKKCRTGEKVAIFLNRPSVLILICFIGSTTGAQEKCLDRCGCNMGLEGWSSSAKQCEDGKFSNTNQ